MRKLIIFLCFLGGVLYSQNAHAIDSNCVDTCSQPWGQWQTSEPFTARINFDSCTIQLNYRWRINCDGKIEIEYGELFGNGTCPCIDFRFHELISRTKAAIAGLILDQSPPGISPIIATRLDGSCYTWFYIWVPKDLLDDIGWGNEISSYDSTWNDDPIYYKMKKMIPCEKSCCLAELTRLPSGSGYTWTQTIVYSGECGTSPPPIGPMEDFVYYVNGVKHTVPCVTELPLGGMVCEVICTNEFFEGRPNDGTSTIDLNLETIFKVYPIPFYSSLTIEVFSNIDENNGILEIKSINGQTLVSRPINLRQGEQELVIDGLGDLPRGNYLLTIQIKDNRYNYKISK